MLSTHTTLIVITFTATAVLYRLRRLKLLQSTTATKASKTPLRSLAQEAVPLRLRTEFYFDLDSAIDRGCEHARYLREARDIGAALDGLHEHVLETLRAHASAMPTDKTKSKQVLVNSRSTDTGGCVGLIIGRLDVYVGKGAVFMPERLIGSASDDPARVPLLMMGDGACVQGGTFDVSAGDIWLGAGASVEPGALIRGPCILGAECSLRRGAYIRGDVLLGNGSIVGCEMKHAIALDGAELPHHGYVGDSLLGYRAHFGCGAVTANFPLFPTSLPSVDIEGVRYDLGRRKFGAVVGDRSQLGCQSVTEPGCLLGPDTHTYPHSRLPRGIYGPGELLKNRPCIEVAPLVS